MHQPREIPRTKQELDNQYVELEHLILDHIEAKQKHRYQSLVLDLEADTLVYPKEGRPQQILLGMKRAPAARGNHHDFEGGLVYYLLEMWETWKNWKGNFDLIQGDYINDNRVLQGILNHDIHKAYRYYRLRSEHPWEVEFALDESDKMVIENVKSIQVLNWHGIILDDQQMNALLWSEGGFSKTQPRTCSVLAKLLYLLDEFSGNVLGRIAKRTFLDLRTPCET